MRARVIAYMAGAEAEVQFFGLSSGGDADDRHQIDLMLDSLLPAGADLPIYEGRLRRFSRQLVRRHRGLIEIVARELVTRQHLSAEQLDQLVGNAGGEPGVKRGRQSDDAPDSAMYFDAAHRPIDGFKASSKRPDRANVVGDL